MRTYGLMIPEEPDGYVDADDCEECKFCGTETNGKEFCDRTCEKMYYED